MAAQTRYKILIVDDNPRNLFTLQQLLKSHFDVEILEAASGLEALEKISRGQDIDLLILDIQMPHMSGFEVAELVRQRQKYQDIPIIFLTAVYKSERFKFQGLAGGAIDYLTKPIDDDMLINRIGAYLRVIEKERQQNRRLQELNDLLQEEVEERKRAQKALIEAKELAEAANRSKSAFLANMSHELRTPLNGILGYAQILERDSGLTESQKKDVSMIQQSGKHLLTLLTDILDLSKLDSGKLEYAPKDFHWNDALQRLIEYIQTQALQKDLTFFYERAPTLPDTLYGDEKRLRQILLNLLGNAIKFTKKGRVTLRIVDLGFETPHLKTPQPTIDNHASKIRTIRFEVEDTGAGIPEERLHDLFTPFECYSSSNSYTEGARLGLALSQRLLQQMNSDLQVSSTVGVGSRFSFDLRLPERSRQKNEASFEYRKHIRETTGDDERIDVSLPDEEELRELYTLATIGDILAIRRKLAHLENSDADTALFVDKLRTFAEQLNILKIQQYLKQYIKEAE